ncbi:hypothetical protein GCM10009544_16640 [Streptomyces stramineus]|uniref:Uncharacterized protein n=1 Tax=Streptomyces stramineus TaxID=173861 RepID=A0ABN0ZPD0_9ACTN
MELGVGQYGIEGGIARRLGPACAVMASARRAGSPGWQDALPCPGEVRGGLWPAPNLGQHAQPPQLLRPKALLQRL